MSERVDQWPGDNVVSCQILGYYLAVTCESHPEQYDVFKGEKHVGYLRMRHGHFRAHAFAPCGPVVFEANPRGDGCFEDDERNLMLAKAVIAIDDYFALTKRHINFLVQQLEGEKGRIDGISIADAKALAASLNAREEELERLKAENAAQAAEIGRLKKLLKQATPEEMGGRPELFAPPGGWERWELKVNAAIADKETTK